MGRVCSSNYLPPFSSSVVRSCYPRFLFYGALSFALEVVFSLSLSLPLPVLTAVRMYFRFAILLDASRPHPSRHQHFTGLRLHRQAEEG